MHLRITVRRMLSFFFGVYLAEPASTSWLPGFIGMRRAFQEVVSMQPEWSTLADEIRFHVLWMQIVSAYSRRQLTDEKDRLVALLGVARTVQEKTKAVFVEGLWHEVLGLNLLWVSESPMDPSESRASHAPTWSWASAQGPVDDGLAAALRSEGASESFSSHAIVFLLTPHFWELDRHDERHDGTIGCTALVHPCAAVLPLSNVQTFPYRNCTFRMDVLLAPDDWNSLQVLPIVRRYGRVSEALWNIPRPMAWVLAGKYLLKGERLDGAIQTHGIVLRSTGERDSYERVGYFVCESDGLEWPDMNTRVRLV